MGSDLTPLTELTLTKCNHKVWQPRPPLFLTTTKNYFLDSSRRTLISVTAIRRDEVFQEPCCKYLFTGDTKCTPPKIEILPITLLTDLEGLFLLAQCAHPPFYLPRGQTIAQVIPTPREVPVDDHTPEAYGVEVVGEDKPKITFYLNWWSKTLGVEGLLDTEAHVTIIRNRMWPSHWELQPLAGKIQGIGGAQLARISKDIIQIKGPEGQLASLHPFVVDYKVPL